MSAFNRETALLVMGLLTSACASKLANLRTQAGAELGCNEASLTTKATGVYVEQVTGCGNSNVYYYALKADKRWLSPLERATFDLSCAREKLTTTVLSAETVGVTGCGKKATYLLYRDRGLPTAWVLDAEQTGP